LSTYCKNNTLTCDFEGLQWHWSNVGERTGLSLACVLPDEQLKCYAKNYPDIFRSYCSTEDSKCDLVALQWHWRHVGDRKEYVTICREPPERLRCYAMNYPDIFKAYCANDESKCDLAGLQWHWTNRGQARGMSTGCSTPERLRCYAQNYPNVFRAYCEGDGTARCDLSGLRWHWFTVGEKQGMKDTCPDAPIVAWLRRVFG